MKKILLLTLGGTISAKGHNRLDLKDYTSGLISGKEYLNDLPELNDIADLTIITMDSISSTQIDWKHWSKLKTKIEYYLNEKNFDGVVISHGTNTLEETAYFLQLTINSTKPVVLVGSQRPYNALSSDAQLNLIHAVTVAAHHDSMNKGVLVVFNQKIHSAREVTKIDTYNIEGFDSGHLGCLGFIDAEHHVIYYRSPLRKHTITSHFRTLHVDKIPDVEIVYSYAGATGNLIDFITESKQYKGIVVAGTGAGRFSKKEEHALIRAIDEGLVVVRSNRVGSGRVLALDPYHHVHALHADNLNPQKARILLSLSLMQDKDIETIQNYFDTH